jgi:hypothetical protein
MCAPRLTRHTSIWCSSSCHTGISMGISIFFTAAIIRDFRSARSRGNGGKYVSMFHFRPDRRIRGTKCLPLVALLNITDTTYIVQHGSHVNTDVYFRAICRGGSHLSVICAPPCSQKLNFLLPLPSLSPFLSTNYHPVFRCLSVCLLFVCVCQLLSNGIIALHINRSTTWERTWNKE